MSSNLLNGIKLFAFWVITLTLTEMKPYYTRRAM